MAYARLAMGGGLQFVQDAAVRSHVPGPAARPNRTYAFGALKPILAGCLLGIAQAWAALPDTLAAMGRSRCRIQPGRSYPRPPRSKPHLHMSYKGALS